MTANTPHSRKQKGFDFQKQVAKDIRDTLNLDDMHVISTPSSVGGEDLWLSPKAKLLFPYSVEVKRTEKIELKSWLHQAKNNTSEDRHPMVIFKRNHDQPYVVLPWYEFLRLLSERGD